MTLDEAIKHCEEESQQCGECGKDHAQLAEWLKELKELRKRKIWHNTDCGEYPRPNSSIYVASVSVDGCVKYLEEGYWSEKNQCFMTYGEYEDFKSCHTIWCYSPEEIEDIPEEWYK